MGVHFRIRRAEAYTVRQRKRHRRRIMKKMLEMTKMPMRKAIASGAHARMYEKSAAAKSKPKPKLAPKGMIRGKRAY